MNRTVTGALSGCIVWIVMFGILGLCLLPVSMLIGGFTSVSRFAIQTLAPVICPAGTTAEPYSYATPTTDKSGTPSQVQSVNYTVWMRMASL